MADENTRARGAELLRLHQDPELLTVVNVWDAVTAKVVAGVPGTKALATASHSIAASYGYPDGEQIPVELMIEAVGRIVAATELPVTADLEGGYGDAPEAVRRAIGVGAVGANIEDQMKPLAESVAQVEAVMKAAEDEGVDFVLNARTDAFALGRDRDKTEVFADAVERGKAYLDAGAPVVFVPARLNEEQVAHPGRGVRPAAADPDRDPGHALPGTAGGARRRTGVLRPDGAGRRPDRPGRTGRGRAPRRRRTGQHADAELTGPSPVWSMRVRAPRGIMGPARWPGTPTAVEPGEVRGLG